MNKFLLFVIFLIYQFNFSQFTVDDHHGNQITDGTVILRTGYGESNDLDLNIVNTSTATINVKAKLIGLVNTDGHLATICIFENCFGPIALNDEFPSSSSSFSINVGASSDPLGFDHFINNDPGSGQNFPIDYVFKIYQVNSSGTEIGTSVTFTYRYNPTASYAEDELVNFKLYPTLVESVVNFEFYEDVNIRIFNQLGSEIERIDLNKGLTTVDVSHLKSGIYMLKISNAYGLESTKRIIVK